MLEARAARGPHPKLYRKLITRVDSWCQHLIANTVKVKSLANLAGGEGSAVLQSRVIDALNIVGIPIARIPRRQLSSLRHTDRSVSDHQNIQAWPVGIVAGDRQHCRLDARAGWRETKIDGLLLSRRNVERRRWGSYGELRCISVE